MKKGDMRAFWLTLLAIGVVSWLTARNAIVHT